MDKMKYSMSHRVYTCQHFLSRKCETFTLRVTGFFVDDPIISEDIPKISEGALSEEFRSSQENENTTSSPVLSLLKSEVSGKVQSFTWTFLFLHWFEFILRYTVYENVSVKAVIAQIFLLGVRNWSASELA